jgi:adenine-specific DNA-methyltransferase
MTTELCLDHVGIVVPDLEAARQAYDRLGFRLTPRSPHEGRLTPDGPVETWGSGNHCAMFRRGYLELLGITDPGDLVLDSFLGSGTTAAVAHKMGRRYIGIEMGEHARTHCAPRLQKVIDGEQGGISESTGWKGGGGFRFYRLGSPVFDEEGHIRQDIRFPVLAAHVWFSETDRPWDGPNSGALLGIQDGTAFALLYNGILGDKRPGGGNVLTRATLAAIRENIARTAPDFDGPLTVYGEQSRLMPATLDRERITFKQTPYDVKARA